ncbi:CfaE/CblD family pilus tip adhesin [Stenotrophomonas maltophilia]|uniref:CfaE/CblD family pilus tip adhesin n=1 Tax=Stenotrophomonas maltophilia TaxID=40324 RepID=UPI0019540EB0
MKPVRFGLLLLVGALVAVVPRAWTQQPPETHPSSDHQTITLTFDRSSPPGDVVLWAPRTVLAFSTAGDRSYAVSHLTCRSSSDSQRGSCPTEGSPVPTSGASKVLLRAVERRTGLRTEIRLTGWIERPMTGQACGADYWHHTSRALWSSFLDRCSADYPAGIGAGLNVPADELARLVAGHWDAELVLDLRAEQTGPILASYSFTFDLTITDHNNVAIYFPLFDFSAPLVDLNLQYNPISRPPSIGGSTVLDMCLYDGLGSQSEFLGVTVRNRDPRPPGPSGFSVWHQDGADTDRDRVDLNVSLDHDGRKVRMANGVEQELRGIDTAKLRLVVLPGMTQPVFCVPTPLTLETPSFDASSKRNGTYEGELQVELRLPTSRP